MKKIFTLILIAVSIVTFAETGYTTVEKEKGLIFVTTTNFALANSLQNNSNVVDYLKYENGEIGKTEYAIVFKDTQEANSFIFEKMNRFDKSAVASNTPARR